MTALRSGLAAAALLLSACGPKEISLPADPIDRAATCGIVTAADARLRIDVKASLPLETQGRILHYALITASEGGTFVADKANAVSRQMSALQDHVTKGKWQALGPACAAAYPLAAKTDVTLPAGRLDAQLQCEELADFLGAALQPQEVNYGDELAGWSHMRRVLNDALAPGLGARAGAGLEAQQRERHEALAAAAKLGSPAAVMAACLKRFGSTS